MASDTHICWVDDSMCPACGSELRPTERGRMVAAILFVTGFLLLLGFAGWIEGGMN